MQLVPYFIAVTIKQKVAGGIRNAGNTRTIKICISNFFYLLTTNLLLTTPVAETSSIK